MKSGFLPFLVLAGTLFGQEGDPQQQPQQPPRVQNWPSQDQQQQRDMPPPQLDARPAPPQLTLPAGTWITVHINSLLASDRNRQGDAFTATLAKPLVANGFVVARRGQTIGGRVAEADKGGRVKGTSKLSVELTDLSVIDGQQVPLKTELIQHSAGTSHGRDAAGIATTTGVGAAIGAGVNGGVGAGVGAGIGAVVGTLGVLLTHGSPTVIYPEDTLTFRLQEAITVSTDRSPGAFVAVNQSDYEPRLQQGHGGALLREKIVASASRKFTVIVDQSKLVKELGTHFEVPIEVVQFGWQAAARKLTELGGKPAMRMSASGTEPFMSDGGHYIIDCKFAAIADPDGLAKALDGVVGVVEHGLFLHMCSKVLVGEADGVKTLTPTGK